MENVNEASKLVAQAKDALLYYLSSQPHEIDILRETVVVLDQALDKLT